MIDTETSWTSAVLGTMVNGVVMYQMRDDTKSGRSVWAVVIVLQIMLALQVVEALQWRNINDDDTRSAAFDYTGAWIIMAQPLLWSTAAWYSNDWKSPKNQYRAMALKIVTATSLGLILYIMLTTVQGSLEPSNDAECVSIQYNVMSGAWMIVYSAACVGAMLMLRSALVGVATVVCFGAAYVIGRIIVADKRCDATSLWTWAFSLTMCFVYSSYEIDGMLR